MIGRPHSFRRQHGFTLIELLLAISIMAMLLVALFTGYSIFLFTPAAATLQQLQVGMAVPDFSLKLISGETRSFSEIKGQKMTIIVFWSTWDKKSETALARLQKLHMKYRDQGLAVVAVNADGQNFPDSTMGQIRAKIERLGVTFPVFIDHGLAVIDAVNSALGTDQSREYAGIVAGAAA